MKKNATSFIIGLVVGAAPLVFLLHQQKQKTEFYKEPWNTVRTEYPQINTFNHKRSRMYANGTAFIKDTVINGNESVYSYDFLLNEFEYEQAVFGAIRGLARKRGYEK